MQRVRPRPIATPARRLMGCEVGSRVRMNMPGMMAAQEEAMAAARRLGVSLRIGYPLRWSCWSSSCAGLRRVTSVVL
jgi:hypothetical protein